MKRFRRQKLAREPRSTVRYRTIVRGRIRLRRTTSVLHPKAERRNLLDWLGVRREARAPGPVNRALPNPTKPRRRPVRRNGAGDGFIDEHGFHPIRGSSAYDEYKLYRGTIKRIGTYGFRRNPKRTSRRKK